MSDKATLKLTTVLGAVQLTMSSESQSITMGLPRNSIVQLIEQLQTVLDLVDEVETEDQATHLEVSDE